MNARKPSIPAVIISLETLVRRHIARARVIICLPCDQIVRVVLTSVGKCSTSKSLKENEGLRNQTTKKRINNNNKKKNARIYFFHGGATSIKILNRFGVLVQYHGVELIKLIKSALFDRLNS